MKLIKSIHELPSWYNLKNYKNANKLSSQGWFANLAIRKEASQYFSSIGIPIKYCGYNSILESSPIVMSEIHSVENAKYEDNRYNLVYTLDKYQAYSIFLDLPQTEQNKINKMFIDLSDEDTDVDIIEEITNELDAPLYQELILNDEKWKDPPQNHPFYEKCYNTLFAGINLEASDDIIFEHFKIWLKNARKTHNLSSKKSQYSESKFRLWSDASVLPYLDLRNWADENNLKITDKIMGEAIYSEEKIVTIPEAVRKTTKTTAEKLMRYGWAILRQQALSEQYPIK